MNKLFVCLIVFCSQFTYGQNLSPQDVIAKSIEYHDPSGVLFKKEVTLNFIETRPKGDDRKSTVSFDIKKEKFQLASYRGEDKINSFYKKGQVTYSVNGKSDISQEMIEKYRLNKKRITMMKNYYEYLWLMPMKLTDQGALIHNDVKKVDFFGKELLQIKVSYTEEVGKDIWYFYFNPSSYAMQGYRFYHDEIKNDGEYIILEGETQHKKVRLPKSRTWYTHKENKLLGTDILAKLSY